MKVEIDARDDLPCNGCMSLFDDIKPGARIRGLEPAAIAEIVSVTKFGPDAINLVFRTAGRVAERLIYRGEETGLEVLRPGNTYSFGADGALLKLASEAYRIRLAHLFDPYLAATVHSERSTSLRDRGRPSSGDLMPSEQAISGGYPLILMRHYGESPGGGCKSSPDTACIKNYILYKT